MKSNHSALQKAINAVWSKEELRSFVDEWGGMIEAAGAPSADLEFTGTVTIQAADAEKKGPRRFDMEAYFGGELIVANYPLPVVVDLATLKGTEKARPVLKDHNDKVIIGHTQRIDSDGRKITASGIFSGVGAPVEEILQAADNGFPWSVSIGAKPGRLERIDVGKSVSVNHQTFTGPLLVARGAGLREISFVSIPADDQASARIAAKAAEPGVTMPTPFDKWLEGKGIAAADLTDAVQSTLQAHFDAEEAAKARAITAAGGGAKKLDDVLRLEHEKEARQKKIVDITARAIQDNPGQLPVIEALSKQAILGDWDEQKYELEMLRACRPQANARLRSSADEGLTGNIIEAAVCLTGGIDNPEKIFDERTLEAASKRFNHGIGLQEIFGLFARRNGHEVTSYRDVRGLLEASFVKPDRMITASGISTLSLPNILSNVANKFLRMGFDSIESTWRAIAAIKSVNDFKLASSYSLSGDFDYIELPPGGQIKHAVAGETAYTNQAKTYARMMGIDRRDIINDDLGALTDVPKRLGRGGALKFNTVFWTAFLNNSSFFSAGNANYITGATVGTNDSRLGVEGLTYGSTSFLNQTDPDGKPMAVEPKILLVPNALYVSAKSLMGDAEIRNTTANTTFTTGNPFTGNYTIARSSYLSNSTITGYSTTAWYLLADPNDAPVIEAAFLNGVQTPTVEQADADFNQLGVQMRGYHDFGIALQEYRGGLKSKGAA